MSHVNEKRYFIYFATNNPFSQYVEVARLTDWQVCRLAERFERLEEDGAIHAHVIESFSPSETAYSRIVQELNEVLRAAGVGHHLSRGRRCHKST